MTNAQRIEIARERRARLLSLLRDAALAGRHCPTNIELGVAMGCTAGLISHDLHVMRLEGSIRTRRTGTAREVEFSDGVTIATDDLWSDVRNRVCAAFDLPLYKLVASGRKGYVVRVRKAAAWVMRHKCKGISTLSIGRLMGGKDHSSVIHYIGAAEILRERDEQFRAITDAILHDQVPPKPRVRKVIKRAKPQLVPEYRETAYSWCEQCQSRVADERAMRCASRWCSLKAVA